MTPTDGLHDLREEVLEQTWNLCERGDATLTALARAAGEDVQSTAEQLAIDGLIEIDGESVTLTDEGEREARHVVRANRLAARLLTDLLEQPPESVEAMACRLEHAITPALADALCTMLGHPPNDQEGRPIPRGGCCDQLRTEVGPVIRPVTELSPGEQGRVTFVHSRIAERLEQLSALGLVPGTTVRLKQLRPATVLEIGETTIALARDVAADVYVKPA